MIRIGAIDFLNAAPLCGLLSRDDPRWQIVDSSPSELARALRQGNIDVGLVPQVEACRRTDYRILEGHCISCLGEVASILLFQKKPWPTLQRVAVDQASNSSVALLQVLRHLDHLPPLQIIETPSDLSLLQQDPDLDAVLLIGDAALQHRSRSPLDRIDLGEAWKQRTDLPFVFAVWLTSSQLDPSITAELARAAQLGIAQSSRFATHFSKQHPDVLDEGAAQDYLQRCIRYSLGTQEKESIAVFHRLRAEIDPSLDRAWRPRYYGETS
ncbi:MAG: menaquinone biosynthesis protein [Planctomycetota bacterium]|nr:menaquinone biosynthesis protein [Planctomycetota bacterium]